LSPLPTQFGRYSFIQALGSGDGVCLAVGPGPDPLCVVRRPPADRRLDPEFLSRFQRAAHLSRRLAHDGLAAVHDVGDMGGEAYWTEEFVEGHDLAELLRRCATEVRPIPVVAALHVGRVVSQALRFLHEFDGLGLVHRKLGPTKIRVGYDGGVKLLDLVSGRAAGADGALRSAFFADDLPYLAPEQLTGGTIDGRADIYALGVVLWEILAGRSLLSTLEGGLAGLARDREQAIERVRTQRPSPPSQFNQEVGADVDAVVMRALAKTPEERFASAGDLERVLAAMTGQAARDAAARLMNRLFDASRERDERAALLATAGGLGSRPARADGPEPFGLTGSSVADSRGVRTPAQILSSAPVRSRSLAEGTPAAPSRSVTTIVSRNAQWLRRFFLIFGCGVVAATAFNIFMTRHLDAKVAADSAQAPEPTAARTSGAAEAKPPAGESSLPRPIRGAEPSAPVKPLRPSAEPAPSLARAAEPPVESSNSPADKPRPRASGDGKKALSEARAAFEGDDFLRAIAQGRAAVAAGEGGAHAILGAAYFKVGRYEDSVREYGEALRLDPGNPALAKRVEIARRAAGRHAEGATP